MIEKPPLLSAPRLRSLDVFRGMVIVLMIIVNSPGNQSSYALLEHATWNGCTLADLVFPFFLFIIGITTVFSLTRGQEKGLSHPALLQQVIRRSMVLFIIGIALNLFFSMPYHMDHIRIYGVLQRIALCYLIGSCFFLYTSEKIQVIAVISILLSYATIIIYYSPLHYDATNNIAAYIDQHVFSAQHLYGKTNDPEGLLSSLPAIATVLIGQLTGYALCQQNRCKLHGLWVAGILCCIMGWIWGYSVPFNKTLWSSSYVLWTSGLALIVLSACYWIIDIQGIQRWAYFFEVFGVNAILAYILHVLFLKIQAMIIFNSTTGAALSLRPWLTSHLFSWTTPENASLGYALGYLCLWFIILAILYRRKIYFKI